MIELFPFFTPENTLAGSDFSLFAQSFRQRISQDIPHNGEIFFLQNQDPVPKVSSDPRVGSALATHVSRMRQGEYSVYKAGNQILMVFPSGERVRTVVLITGVDPLLIEHSAIDWLEELRERFIHDLCMIKARYTDMETGLLNSAHLFAALGAERCKTANALFLVSLPLNAKQARDGFRHSKRAAKVLAGLTGGSFSLHYLGQSLFALLVPASEPAPPEEVSARFVQLLRREGFTRVHIGSVRISARESRAREIVDCAWTSLQVAARRGPFAFCDYSFLASAKNHPLRSVDADLMNQYLQVSRNVKPFAVLQFSCESAEFPTNVLTRVLAKDNTLQVLGQDFGPLIKARTATGDEAVLLGQKIVALLEDEDADADWCCGVSCFPFQGFSRREVILNSRKALFHAQLLGPGKSVLFDAVSLNVSGDIYFGDGDMAGALKEYRRGAMLESRDVNLLNSLGVTHALLNQNSAAKQAFAKALDIDEKNALALYNLGFGAQVNGNLEEAVRCFERAHSACQLDDDSGVCQEVDIQLGHLYCKLGRYEEGVACLTNWLKTADARQHGRAYKCLGEAYLGAGQAKEAMGWLQKALRQNENDPDSLSLLGVATWQAGQGDDIALSFCMKSVDLMPEDSQLRLRLANLQREIGRADEALLNLLLCNGRNELLSEIQLAKAQTFSVLGDFTQARIWARRVQRRVHKSSALHKQAGDVLRKIKLKRGGE